MPSCKNGTVQKIEQIAYATKVNTFVKQWISYTSQISNKVYKCVVALQNYTACSDFLSYLHMFT